MRQFVAGVGATVLGLVLVGWVNEALPTFDSAHAAAVRVVEASASVAGSAAPAALVLTCVVAAGAVAYGVHRAWTAQRGMINLGLPILSTVLAGALLYRGLDIWSKAAVHGPVVVALAVLVGAFAVRAGRQRLEAIFRFA